MFLSVVIHRPSSIMGDGSGKLDLMSNMFKYVKLLEAVPQGAAWRVTLISSRCTASRPRLSSSDGKMR